VNCQIRDQRQSCIVCSHELWIYKVWTNSIIQSRTRLISHAQHLTRYNILTKYQDMKRLKCMEAVKQMSSYPWASLIHETEWSSGGIPLPVFSWTLDEGEFYRQGNSLRCPLYKLYRTLGGKQSRHTCYGEMKDLFLLTGIEHHLLGRPYRRLLVVPTELSYIFNLGYQCRCANSHSETIFTSKKTTLSAGRTGGLMNSWAILGATVSQVPQPLYHKTNSRSGATCMIAC
jgi:hypothetical protein